MHYDAVENEHGLKHDPFKAIVAPRPIGWISSVSKDGICNLSPYSFFNAIGDRPHYVMFSSSGMKDSVRNIHETGEFTCSLATWDTREAMNVSSAPVPPNVDEYPLAGLTAVASTYVRPPRVKEAPAAMECKHWQTIELPGRTPEDGIANYVVIGQVVGIFIDDTYVSDGIVNTGAMRPISRMGYMEYAVVTPETVFAINRPKLDAEGRVVQEQAKAWTGGYP